MYIEKPVNKKPAPFVTVNHFLKNGQNTSLKVRLIVHRLKQQHKILKSGQVKYIVILINQQKLTLCEK